MKWFKDITTDNQNDFDLVSICGVIAFAGLMFFTAYTVYKTGNFDPITYSTGAGALLLGIGGGYRVKSGLPKDNPDKSTN